MLLSVVELTGLLTPATQASVASPDNLLVTVLALVKHLEPDFG